MTQVDFYILRGESAEARLRTACRLADKAVQLDQHVFIRSSTEGEARQLDELLWTFSESSFLPHRIVAPGEAAAGGGAAMAARDAANGGDGGDGGDGEDGGDGGDGGALAAARGAVAGEAAARAAAARELNGESLEPVLIGVDAGPVRGRWDLLINLGEDVPAVGGRYARIAEIVDADPERRHRGRERYKHYRERGFKLLTHEL